jgi:hypothetical protein
MKEPVDHIPRPLLPWRAPSEADITECGARCCEVRTITREAFRTRVKAQGIQRAAMITCMTCLHAIERSPSWAEEPRLVLQRAIEWENPWWSVRSIVGSYVREQRGHLLKDELVALAALAEAHPEEFKAALERQKWLSMKASREANR